MSKDELPAGSRPEQNLSDYSKMSDDDLDNILKGNAEDPTQPQEAEAEVEEEEVVVDEKEEKEEDEAADDAEEEAEADPKVEKEADDKEEPEAKEDPVEQRFQNLEKRLALEALKRERAEEKQHRAELLASRHAGRAGYLQQQLKKGSKPAAEGDDATAEGSDDAWEQAEGKGAEQAQTKQNQPVFDDTRVELMSLAINDEGNQFTQAHAAEFERLPEGFETRLAELVREEAALYRDDFKAATIPMVRKLARSIMTSAYATAQIEYAEKVTEQATVRKAESTAKSKRLKKKAAISKSGRGPAKPKPKPSSYEDMSDAELDAEFEREFGDNHRQGPKRAF
jgi:hypothetical protein